MAALCYNSLILLGDAERVYAVRNLFQNFSENQSEDKSFLWPDFITGPENSVWFVSIDGSHINYQTHLVPNLFSLQQIADRFHIGFVLRYRELHSFLYGEATYRNGLLSDIALTATDFAGYHFDHHQKQFIYKGRAFNWEEELIECLLGEKKALITGEMHGFITSSPG